MTQRGTLRRRRVVIGRTRMSRGWAPLAVAACLAAAVLSPAGATPSPGPVDPASSTVVASPTSVPADDTTNSTITVTLKDTAGNPVPGWVVSLNKVSGVTATFAPSSTGSATGFDVSGLDGVATFTARSSFPGSATFQAIASSVSNVTITQTATVVFTEVVDLNSGPITIDAVTPDHGPTLGRTITITGPGVGTATSVTFGTISVPVIAANTVSATSIEITTPEVADAGRVDLRVVNRTGSSAPVPYTFVAPTAGHWARTTLLHHDMPYVEGIRRAKSFLVTRLDDGTVLVVGRPRESTTPLPTWAEIYDPTADSWSTCSAANARAGCPAPPPAEFDADTATVVADGRVLVSGAVPNNLYTDPREVQGVAYLYEPATGTWHDAGRPFHSLEATATLLSGPGCEPSCGKVLVAGGYAGVQGEPGCVTLENSPYSKFACAAELYDPASNTWASTGSMTHRRAVHSASPMAGGGVLVTGGLDLDQGAGLDTAEIYHPATGSWSEARSFNRGREAPGIVDLPGGGVMLVGGYTAEDVNPTGSAELYNPRGDSWSYLGSLNRPRAGGSVVLVGGRAMVVGGGSQPFQGNRPDNTAEIYDPTAIDAATGKAGAWDYVVPMLDKLRFPVAVALADRRVLVVGAKGQTAEVGAELFSPGPVVASLSPALGPKGGGTVVTLRGTDLDGASAARFGDVTVGPDRMTQVSPTEVQVVSPPHAPGPVPVTVTTTIGDSSPSPTAVFTYYGTPGTVANPNATATAPGEITVSFDAAGSDGDSPPPVGDYQIHQSPSPIDASTFDSALSVCGISCHLPADAVGQRLVLPVGDLDDATTYHYAIRAVGADGQLGPVSADASATTAGTATCPAVQAVAGQVLYPIGYSLVGLPGDTTVGANSPLYGWFDQGTGGAYSTAPAGATTTAGRAYWAWFACPRAVTLSMAAVPATMAFPLGAYHASMVGNPSPTSPARVVGQDFSARWDPRANNGAGGYRISAYRVAQTLAVGEGAWSFSYVPTEVTIATQP